VRGKIAARGLGARIFAAVGGFTVGPDWGLYGSASGSSINPGFAWLANFSNGDVELNDMSNVHFVRARLVRALTRISWLLGGLL